MPPRKKQPTGPVPVEAFKHEDKRVNIPTADSSELVSPDVAQPTQLRYPRNPDLDPQLVWRGKDEQDGEDLVVDAPPIYIQEKIVPQVIIENLRKVVEKPQLTLFEEFDGLEGYEAVEYYQHEANWSNRMILGDSLQVMASLAEKESLRGKVQMVYMDPPYGIKFDSNWQVRTIDATSQTGKARRRYPRSRADQGVPRHMGTRNKFIPRISPRPANCCPRLAYRVRQHLHPNRRRECPPGPGPLPLTSETYVCFREI